eukprot:COSAG02_NODE_3394_length_6814_cov_8.672971_4_plen_43_part_00
MSSSASVQPSTPKAGRRASALGLGSEQTVEEKATDRYKIHFS